MAMKITDVRTRLLVFPLPAPFRPAWARGRELRDLTMVLVEIETDEGILGLGASHAGMEAIVAVERFVRPFWLGQDPLAVERLTGVLRDAEILGPPVYFMEIPLWDIVGKRAGLPVYQLWGGYQDAVPAYCATGEVRTPEQRVEDAWRMIEQGFRAVKLRFHHDDPRDDLAVVRAVRDAVGERLQIIVDANQAGVEPGTTGHRTWGYATAYAVARELEELGVLWLEEPLPRHDYEGLTRLRGALNRLMLAGGEDNHGLHEFKLLLDRGCYDILQPDALLSEGIFQLRKVGGLAEAAHRLLVPHTWGNGMGLQANLHLAASLPNCPWLEFPHDPPSGWTATARDSMLAEPLWIDAAGRVAVPDRPGFGFVLDEEAVAHHTVRAGTGQR
jgi:L-alanine-DL-glutamate epimerase-like enolase superfamily enzyme